MARLGGEAGDAHVAGARSDGDRYAFVSGMKKSGTNWVAKVIGTHPDVVVWGELHLELLHDALLAYGDPEWIDVTRTDLEAVWEDVALAVLDRRRSVRRAEDMRGAAGQVGGPRVYVDHTPTWAHLHLGDRARYVHIVRDVRDVIVSDAFHAMRHGEYPPLVAADQRPHVEAWQLDPFYFARRPDALLHPLEVERLAATWLDVVAKALDLQERHPDLLTVVSYEALHDDVFGVRGSLCSFLGLDPSQAATELADHLLPGFGGREERPAEFLRKGTVGDHRTYFTAESTAIVERIAGGMMARRGYH